jgi:hypothetical protein
MRLDKSWPATGGGFTLLEDPAKTGDKKRETLPERSVSP